MLITELNIRTVLSNEDGVLAYVHLVLDDQLALKDLRLIRKPDQSLLLVMPNRPKTQRCPGCNARNSIIHRFCHKCAELLPAIQDDQPFVDVAHPINRTFRQYLEQQIINQYRQQVSPDKPSQPPKEPKNAQ